MAASGTIPAIEKGPPLEDADQALLRRLRAGEAAAFDELVASHRQRVTRLAWRLVGWRGEVEDIVQDVFLIAYRKLRGFRGQSSLATWLAGITVNRCRAARRKWLPSWRWLEALWRRRSPQASPDQRMVRDETALQVRKAVRQMSAADREVIVLYYLEEMSVSQIAQLLAASAGAIDVRLSRAREKLRAKLSGLEEEQSDGR